MYVQIDRQKVIYIYIFSINVPGSDEWGSPGLDILWKTF